jgi:PmbA protein
MLDFLEYAVRKAEEKGAYQAEAYLHGSKHVKITVEKSQLKNVEKTHDMGIGIRAAIKKQDKLSAGFAFLTNLTKKATICAIDYALKTASSKKPNPDFQFCALQKNMQTPKRICDAKLLTIEVENIIELVKNSVNAAFVDKRIMTINGQIDFNKTKVAVVNSLGICGQYDVTSFTVNTSITAKEGNSFGVGWEHFADCFYNENRTYDSFRDSANLAIAQLHPKTAEAGKRELITHPEALSALLSYTLIPWIRADNAQKQSSPFFKKKNQLVASEKLDIIDDGQVPQAIGSKPFDDEGCAKHATPIVEKGKMKGLLYNECSAKKDDTGSTGNASRTMPFNWKPKYALEPQIGPTNLKIFSSDKSRETSLEDMIGEVKDGVMIKGVTAAHTADSATGRFSVIGDCVFEIKNGEVTRPLKQTFVAGNIRDLINSVELFARNTKQVSIEMGEESALISPALLVRNISILG